MKNIIKPNTLNFYTTAVCNLKCSYCYIDKNPALVEIDNLLDESFKGTYYIDFAKELCPDRNQITRVEIWGGEPTLRLDRIYNTIRYIADYYPRFREIMFSTNFAHDAWFEQVQGLLDVLSSYAPRKFIISLQLSIDGPPEINDLGRGAGVTKRFTDNFVKFAKRIEAHDFIPDNVTIQAHFKPTLSSETIRMLQDKESIIRYYQFFEKYNDIIGFFESENFSFQLPVPNTACPSPHTKEDGILFANLCKLTREIEQENAEKKYFKYYVTITPFEPREHCDIGCPDVSHSCGTCGIGLRAVGLLPGKHVSLCHNGFVDLISDYKQKCENHVLEVGHSIDTALFSKNSDLREVNCTVDEFHEFQEMVSSFQLKGSTFQLTQLVAQIRALAMLHLIDDKYILEENAIKAAKYIESSTAYCIRDCIGSSGSMIVAPMGLQKLLLNGAMDYILKEDKKDDVG